MPIDMNFSKATAERFLESYGDDKPMVPAGEEWAADELLTLAGVCVRILLLRHEGLSGAPSVDQHPEHGEAANTYRLADLTAAVNAAARLSNLVVGNRFDVKYEPEVRLTVKMGEDGEPDMTVLSGLKGQAST